MTHLPTIKAEFNPDRPRTHYFTYNLAATIIAEHFPIGLRKMAVTFGVCDGVPIIGELEGVRLSDDIMERLYSLVSSPEDEQIEANRIDNRRG